MKPFVASKVLMVEGIEDDPVTKARAERLLTGIEGPKPVTVDDAELARVIREELSARGHHGMHADIEPVVIFNRYRLDDSEEEKTRRIEAYPELAGSKLGGYGGFDWRKSGGAAYRRETGAVCQPAWAIHSIVGCHFRCAYCNLGHYMNIMMNLEEFVGRLDGWLSWCPAQKLFQYDNYTDAVCFEPEYGMAKLLIEYFAQKPGKALEYYVGKSGYVDFLLDYDHRGHTVCCWSLSPSSQAADFEYLSDSTEERVEGMRKCQEAGYPVRVRLSPMVPVKGWREETRAMLELLFDNVSPDIMTIETLRFLEYDQLAKSFDLSKLDDEFVAVMKEAAGKPVDFGCQIPDSYRIKMYDHIFAELERLSPDTPMAFCREQKRVWDRYADIFARHGQNTARYMCNCGPHCAPATALAEPA
ncbi:MAG: hypothetical protein JXR94_05740 [Candidatus Hydrogenedentes bacterium]|nr:hypothetical protein [Candidatus Hydrogenedentota bacterium]